MTYLLDVNVLIALLDPDHLYHAKALTWFDEEGALDWASSPIVQNGVVRIMGAAAYSSVPFGCGEIVKTLGLWCQATEHVFWPDDISLFDHALIDPAKLTSPGRITDCYLLALAVRRGGKLATLDRRLSPEAVRGGREALQLIL